MIPKISILIASYNAEKTIKRALDSAINQTFKNIEIVCVNDCSSDNTAKIIKQYIKKDSRIKLINNKINLGISMNRNVLIKNSRGEYFTFLDDDDELDLKICEEFVKRANGSGVKCDVAPFKSMVRFGLKGNIRFHNICSNNFNRNTTPITFTEKNLFVPWGYFINRKYFLSLKKTFCPYARTCEDLGFMPYVVLCTKKFMPIPKIGYYYYKVNTGKLSSIKKGKIDTLRDMLLQVDYLLDLSKKKGFLKDDKKLRAIFSAISIGAGSFISKYKIKLNNKQTKIQKQKIKYEYMQMLHIKYDIPLDIYHNSWWKKFETIPQTFSYWRQTKSIKQTKK